MLKQIINWLDPILLIGLLVSIAIGIVMVLTGNDTLAGLTIGLLSTIITLLIDAIARIQKSENILLGTIGLSKIFLDRSIGLSLKEVVNSYETIKGYNFDHYCNIAETTIDECKMKLREIAGGSVIVPAKSVQAYGVKGVQQARQDIKVIHIGSMDFWASDFGRKYFELNREAIKRGVQITRIFTLTSEEVEKFAETLKQQEKIGIRVLIVKPNRIDHEFVIFDDRVLVDFEVDTTRDYRLERIIVDPTQVKRRGEEFEELVSRYAKTIKDIIVVPRSAG